MYLPKDHIHQRHSSMSTSSLSSSFLFGMDHQAVVWCHNLLSPIKTILHTMSQYHYQNQYNQNQYHDRHHLQHSNSSDNAFTSENNIQRSTVQYQDDGTSPASFSSSASSSSSSLLLTRIKQTTGLAPHYQYDVALSQLYQKWHVRIDSVDQKQQNLLHLRMIVLVFILFFVLCCVVCCFVLRICLWFCRVFVFLCFVLHT
jgi:hypothetical protein